MGAMYNFLADMLVYQDQGFLLQTLCFMLEKTYPEVQKILEGAINLEKLGFCTFDNKFNFYTFKIFKDLDFTHQKGICRSHVLAYIACLPEV